MKNLYITLSLLVTMAVAAQNASTAEADKLFKKFEYLDAAKEYLKLAKAKDPYVYKQLAESYYNVYNSKEAIKWYAKAVETKQDAETYYRYAQMLKAEGKYEESNKQMQKFASLAPKDQRAIAFNQDPDYLPKLKSQTKLFDEKILDINDDKYADFGAVLVDNTLYFTSARNTARRTYGRNEEPYLDMYTATYNSDGTISTPTPITEINSKFHDGPAAVTADGNTMYFSSESFKEGNYEKDTPGQRTGLIYLFVATKVNGKWSNIKPVPFNGKTWSTGNPSISKDGKTLYFASNRKGSIGATDIWKVEVKGNNTYSEPVNLGKKINTEGVENFPFITDDNKLYFASDGRKGLGAMDIYVADLTNDSEALNIGLPINSPQDDFAFTFNTAVNKGFFSSNRKGDDNMYLAIPICGVDAVVMVKDSKTGKPLSSASVAILDEKNNVIETRKTNTDGWVTYSVDCNTTYSLVVSADGYKNSTAPVAKNAGGKVEVPVGLDPIESIIVDGKVKLNDIYFEFDKSNITKEGAAELDKLVEVMRTKPELIIMAQAHTDNRGSDQYNLDLSDRRARAVVQYVISKGISENRISGKGYGETQPRVACTECTDEQHAQNRRNEFIIVNK
ncbi:cell envelope biogenesis protein OmpA [Flavobacterium album]|uniref:Cell envelope biogenesis protein OmpA n=1 Tax=Flavobacterium album TaxID=2175091 RepID=A0A2S1QW82_9FLAO|nr:OmpA family protein [Flavobacterium album]AWH84645.1 cell envelope biogenesis protein OmpA [Flavobacterium album]